MQKLQNAQGATFLNKKSCRIDKTVSFGKNVIIHENNIILGNTHIGDNVVLKPNNIINNCQIYEHSCIEQSNLCDSIIGKNCSIGPFARLRPNSKIEDDCKIGNFVEIKNSTIGEGTKASHLAYIGDAHIGKNCNIGCGVIFANYNGRTKNKISIGDNCFIGSNCNLIAPLNVASNTYICAGTTVTEDTNEYDFVIGRVRPSIKPERAKKYLKE
ncbi:MAG: hypothetical protein IJ318_03710 [Clostridia bacterium]|nr:hypothetical protein [Clostridia bacterium]